MSRPDALALAIVQFGRGLDPATTGGRRLQYKKPETPNVNAVLPQGLVQVTPVGETRLRGRGVVTRRPFCTVLFTGKTDDRFGRSQWLEAAEGFFDALEYASLTTTEGRMEWHETAVDSLWDPSLIRHATFASQHTVTFTHRELNLRGA